MCENLLYGSLDLRSKYVYTNGMLVGRIDSSGDFYQYFHDGLGSITMIVDSTGEYQNLYTYDDFGDFRKKEEEVSNSYCYTGQERDEEPSGLYNLRARYYAAGIGRFTQEDPLMAVLDAEELYAFHAYTYVGNNPINKIDPLGLWATLPPNMPDPVKHTLDVIDGADPLPPLLLSDKFSRCWVKCMLGLGPTSTTVLFSFGAKPGGKGSAMLFYHLRYPKWFTAWGRTSKVLVPKLGARIANVISFIGWGITAYDSYSCYKSCSDKDKDEKSPFDPVKYYIEAP